jgi:hypothetical protein
MLNPLSAIQTSKSLLSSIVFDTVIYARELKFWNTICYKKKQNKVSHIVKIHNEDKIPPVEGGQMNLENNQEI